MLELKIDMAKKYKIRDVEYNVSQSFGDMELMSIFTDYVADKINRCTDSETAEKIDKTEQKRLICVE